MKEKTTAVTGSIALAGGAYVSAGVMFAVSVLFARLLEKDIFGLYLFVTSLALMAYLFTDLGIDTLSFYFAAKYRNQSNIVKSVIYLSIRIKTILTVLIFFIFIVIGLMDFRYWYVAFFFIVYVPNYYTRAFLDSLQHFRLSGQLQIAESILKLVLIYVVLKYITTAKLSIILVAIMVPMTISAFFAARDILITLSSARIVNLRELKQEAYIHGKWFALSSILSPVIGNVIQVTLGLLNDFTALAVFGIGRTLSNMVLILGTSFKSVLFPSFLKKTDNQSIRFALTNTIRYMLIFSVFLAFLIHSISSPLITSFYTTKYAESVVIFEILSYGILFSIVFIGLTPATYGAGRPDIYVKVSVINVIVLVTLAIFLIPRYSALGAAIALTSGSVIGTAVFALATFRLLKYSFPWKTLVKCVIAGSFALFPLQIMELFPIYRIIVDVGAGSVIYVIILYAIREIKQEDIELAHESIKTITTYLKEVIR